MLTISLIRDVGVASAALPPAVASIAVRARRKPEECRITFLIG
jgi:hypothetical protein